MKRFLIPFIAVFAFTACSKSDNGNNPEPPNPDSELPTGYKRLKSLTIENLPNSPRTISFSYTQNQIIGEGTIQDSEDNILVGKFVQTYKSGRLIEEVTYNGSVVYQKYTLTYDSEGNLTSRTHYKYDSTGNSVKEQEETTYSYANGKVSRKTIITKKTQNNQLNTYQNEYTYEHQGNVIKRYGNMDETFTYDANGNLITREIPLSQSMLMLEKYEYDNNISVHRTLISPTDINPTGIPVRKNNRIKEEYITMENSQVISTAIEAIYVLKYDKDGYPIEIITQNKYNEPRTKLTLTY